jgi:hypothetical protein
VRRKRKGQRKRKEKRRKNFTSLGFEPMYLC